MLFDLRARGRRRTIQAIYLTLAILMGGGLVLFGIGGNTSGGLFDAFTDNSGGGGNDALEERVDQARDRVRQRPRDPAAWATLTRAQYQVAGIGDNYDQETAQFTEEGRRQLREAARSWQRYLALEPRRPDDTVATLMVQALGPAGLNRPAEAVRAQEIVVAARPASTGLYSNLAVLAYAAGQTRKGDLAAARAVELAPRDQRTAIRDQLRQAERQAAGGGATPGTQTQTTPSG